MEQKIIVHPNNALFQFSDDIQRFCHPLFKKTQIKYFSYVRQYYNERSCTMLSTTPEVCEEIVRTTCYPQNMNELKTYPHRIILCKPLVAAMPDIPNIPIKGKLTRKSDLYRERFDYDYVLSLVKRNTYYCEFFQFATEGDNLDIINFYLSELNTIERFSQFFILQNREQVEEAYRKKHRIALPEFDPFVNVRTTVEQKREVEKEIPLYRQSNQGKYLFEVDQQIVTMTKREHEVLLYLLQGHSAQQTADILGLSRRTVETYLENLKQKMFARNKLELIAKAMPFYQEFYVGST